MWFSVIFKLGALSLSAPSCGLSGGELIEESGGPLGVIPGCLADHGESLELLGHLRHEPHAEAGPELVFCLQLCRASSVQGHLFWRSNNLVRCERTGI
jgi:hypothetical protein